MKFQSILSKLRNSKTAADYEQAAAEIETAVKDAKARLDDLNERKESAFCDPSEGDLKTIRSEITTITLELEDLTDALAVAKRRHEQQVTAEHRAAAESQMKEVLEQAEILRKDYIEIHRLLTKTAKHLENAERIGKEIHKHNDFVNKVGLSDLMIDHPVWLLAQHLDTLVMDPVEAYRRLRYYRPPHPDGSPYRHFKEIKVSHG